MFIFHFLVVDRVVLMVAVDHEVDCLDGRKLNPFESNLYSGTTSG